MQCLRCGKNIPEDAVFCIDCQAEMNKCPVAPGTPVAIPPRPKQNKPRPRTASKDEQISRLRMRTKRMAIAIGKSAEGMSRQPEASGSIRSSMMLGLVFIETAIIYALIVAILIIFVL